VGGGGTVRRFWSSAEALDMGGLLLVREAGGFATDPAGESRWRGECGGGQCAFARGAERFVADGQAVATARVAEHAGW